MSSKSNTIERLKDKIIKPIKLKILKNTIKKFSKEKKFIILNQDYLMPEKGNLW